jgi:membrane protease subunit HflC
MRALAILLIVVVVVGAVFFLPGPGRLKVMYAVDETQLAIKTRFGRPIGDSITTPGLRFKVPFVDKVTYFEKRLLVFDAPPRDLFTQDEERLKIDVYARARIMEPLLFWTTVRAEEQAATTAIGIIASELRREIGSHTLSEIIATERSQIMSLVQAAVDPKLAELGIQLVDLRIKRADFPVEVASKVYDRMSSNLQIRANEERAEGERAGLKTRAEASRTVVEIESTAERDAAIIRGCGESEAITIFADALERDPEFYSFQRSLEVYRVYLAENATLIGSAQDLGEVFEEIRQAVVASAATPAGAIDGEPSAVPTGVFEPPCVVETKARVFLSQELGLATQTALTLTTARQVDWPDVSLGCPVEGQVYAEVVTPGFSLEFQVQGQSYEVHTDREATELVRCIP